MILTNRTLFHVPCISVSFFIWLLPGICGICSAQTATTPATVSKHLLTAEEVFDDARLLEVEIEVDEANWDELRMQARDFASALMKPPAPSPYTWVKAKSVTINGQQISDVAIRKKGFLGSQDTERPSLKIKFDEYTEQRPIEGVDGLTLNNNKQDRGFVSQALTYQLFADAKLPASRCSLAKVSVNGELLGIYTNVESVKKPMLKRSFGDDTGKLYEGTVIDFTVDRVDGFEAKVTDGEDDRAELRTLAELVSDDGDVDLEAINECLALDEFLKFWALESLIGFWDGYTNNQNNFFVYVNAVDAKIHFMPWGADAAFSYDGPAKMFKQGPESVHGKAYLPNRLYHTEGVADRYRETMQGLLDDVWKEDELIAEVDRMEKLVEGHTHASQEDYKKAMESTRQFVKSRRKRIAREFERWPQRVNKQPRKPFYMAKVGKAVGKFNTKWLEEKPTAPYDLGEAELELTLDGKPVKFLRLGVHAILGDQPGPDGTKPATVVFVGKRESNKIKVTFALGTDKLSFEKTTGKPVPAMGVLIEGIFFFGGGVRMLGGTMTLAEAGMEAGDTVRGSLEVVVVQFKGEMR